MSGGKMDTIQICDRLQCLWHSISKENASLLRRENGYLKTMDSLQMEITKKSQTPLNTP